jgi:F-type H+-transporting ATPase subunit epsilon
MATTFQLSVITPTRTLLEEPVISIIVPGSEGYLGVLAHHAPLITAIVPGLLTVRDASNTIKHYAISGGFLEVSDNKAIILADAMEGVDEIDTARARAAEDRARSRLREDGDWDIARCQESLARALNRQKLAKKMLPTH